MSTTKKLNCWESLECGREPGGMNVMALGVCPAAVADYADGVNDGKNAGRICWFVAGTYSGGEVQRTCVGKVGECILCEFFNTVRREQNESNNFTIALKVN